MPTLPKLPKGKDLEDWVAAWFQTAGYYVEKNMTAQESGSQMLELDAVATRYDGSSPKPVLVEVKSGATWGYSDLFKVLGWMQFLGIPEGLLVASQPKANTADFIDSVEASLGPHGLKATVIPSSGQLRNAFKAAGYSTKNFDMALMRIWRFSYWIEREMVEQLKHQAKSTTKLLGPTWAWEYYRLVNDEVFFVPDPRNQADVLYGAFMEHPRLTLTCALEMKTGEFDPQAPRQDLDNLDEALFKGKHPLLQATMYTEHRARIAIMKRAVDYLWGVERGVFQEPAQFELFSPGPALWKLPASFKAGLNWLRTAPGYRQYPLFWQIFMWAWGGFLLADREPEELTAIGKQAGLTLPEARQAIRAMDKLFPIQNGWLRQHPTADYRFTVLMPVPFMGIGAYYRLSANELENYSELNNTKYTAKDLSIWHNSFVDLLNAGH